MHIIKFLDVQNESELDICNHNLREADKQHDLKYFIAATQGWFKLNVGKNFQHFEKFLRDNNFNTHMIATNITNLSNNCTIQPYDNKSTIICSYEAIYSCRKPEFALKELLTHSSSYNENYEKLALAGVRRINNVSDLKELPDGDKLTDNEVNDVHLIANNKKKLIFVPYTLANIINDCTKKYGVPPQKYVMGIMRDSGAPVYGLYINEQLISNVGITMELVNNNLVETLVDLNKIF